MRRSLRKANSRRMDNYVNSLAKGGMGVKCLANLVASGNTCGWIATVALAPESETRILDMASSMCVILSASGIIWPPFPFGQSAKTSIVVDFRCTLRTQHRRRGSAMRTIPDEDERMRIHWRRHRTQRENPHRCLGAPPCERTNRKPKAFLPCVFWRWRKDHHASRVSRQACTCAKLPSLTLAKSKNQIVRKSVVCC